MFLLFYDTMETYKHKEIMNNHAILDEEKFIVHNSCNVLFLLPCQNRQLKTILWKPSMQYLILC